MKETHKDERKCFQCFAKKIIVTRGMHALSSASGEMIVTQSTLKDEAFPDEKNSGS